MIRPRGLDQICNVFGDPRRFLRGDGTPLAVWEKSTLATVTLPEPLSLPLSWDSSIRVARIRCHRLIVDPLRDAFLRVENAGLWPELGDYGGCYAWRVQRASTKLSTHCWGIALDVDVSRNPLGEEPKIHLGVVQAFEGAGFYWGGRFGRPDGMHFQYCEGY